MKFVSHVWLVAVEPHVDQTEVLRKNEWFGASLPFML